MTWPNILQPYYLGHLLPPIVLEANSGYIFNISGKMHELYVKRKIFNNFVIISHLLNIWIFFFLHLIVAQY